MAEKPSPADDGTSSKCASSSSSSSLPPCPYGKECYRQSHVHFQDFDHDHLVGNRPAANTACWYRADCWQTSTEHRAQFTHPTSNGGGIKRRADGAGDVVDPKAARPSTDDQPSSSRTTSDHKHSELSPTTLPQSLTGVYLTKVDASANNAGCVSMKDILSERDDLYESIHFNFMVDLGWLLQQYPVKRRSQPIHVVVGKGEVAQIGQQIMLLNVDDHVTVSGANLPVPYGSHHTKMSMMFYEKEQALRIVISTANLVESDWAMKTQGVYISPLLPKHTASPSTPSSCQSYLLAYLTAYGPGVVPTKWTDHIRGADFGAMKHVEFVGSIPGWHKIASSSSSSSSSSTVDWGLERMARLMDDVDVPEEWPLCAQFSSIGSLGPAPKNWLVSQFHASLAPSTPSSPSPPLRLIYPTVACVRQSFEGYRGGGSLPYRMTQHTKQAYLTDFMHEWKSDRSKRTRAVPHIKTYTRISPDGKQMKWFLLTSANLSKAAWGERQKQCTQLAIKSYEFGVLFTAEKMSLGSLPVDHLLPYDWPLTKYTPHDMPWTTDTPQSTPDSLGYTVGGGR